MHFHASMLKHKGFYHKIRIRLIRWKIVTKSSWQKLSYTSTTVEALQTEELLSLGLKLVFLALIIEVRVRLNSNQTRTRMISGNRTRGSTPLHSLRSFRSVPPLVRLPLIILVLVWLLLRITWVMSKNVKFEIKAFKWRVNYQRISLVSPPPSSKFSDFEGGASLG